MEAVAVIVFVALLCPAAVWGVTREDAKLRRQARRYRELELEGIEHMRPDDPYPEEIAVRNGYLREPDGRASDADRVLYDELQRAREYTLRRGRGAACPL